MADGTIDPERGGEYPVRMSERVAGLETVTQQTLAVLQDVRAEQHLSRSASTTANEGLRRDLTAALERISQQVTSAIGGLRRDFGAEIRSMRHDMDAGFAETRRVHDRDFRISIGVSLATAVGLAG